MPRADRRERPPSAVWSAPAAIKRRKFVSRGRERARVSEARRAPKIDERRAVERQTQSWGALSTRIGMCGAARNSRISFLVYLVVYVQASGL